VETLHTLEAMSRSMGRDREWRGDNVVWGRGLFEWRSRIVFTVGSPFLVTVVSCAAIESE
jgi:hypothetical protein